MHGMKLGRTIGFPTANLDIGDIVLPRAGVYAGWAEVSNRGNLDPSIMPVSLSPHRIPMVMNIGTRPTIDSNEGATKIEAHLLKNEHYELYGTQLKIEPSVFLREEIKFENMDQLKNQIQRDCLQAKYLLG